MLRVTRFHEADVDCSREETHQMRHFEKQLKMKDCFFSKSQCAQNAANEYCSIQKAHLHLENLERFEQVFQPISLKCKATTTRSKVSTIPSLMMLAFEFQEALDR
jgi:hypothetical protein